MEEGNWQRRLEAKVPTKETADEKQAEPPAEDLRHSGPGGNRCRELWSRMAPRREAHVEVCTELDPRFPPPLHTRKEAQNLVPGEAE